MQSIKNLLLPYIKGLLIIVILVIIVVSSTYRALNYVTPKYESASKIKLESSSEGVSSLNLYKNFNVFSVASKIMTEVEVLKSREMIKLVAKKINEPTRYYRLGDFRTSEMYNDSPFRLSDYSWDDKMYNKTISIHFQCDSLYTATIGEKAYTGKVSERLLIPEGWFILDLNSGVLKNKGAAMLYGTFSFKVMNESAMIAFIRDNVDVSSMDKEIPIIRISFKDEVPERTALIVNTIAECYISDYVHNKSSAAAKTVEFISKQLEIVAKELSKSELALEQYKRKYHVVNTQQETETGLKELSQLQLNLISLQVESAAMDSVLLSLGDKESLKPISTNFGAFSDLNFAELVNDINDLLSDRRLLLVKYQPDNEKVLLVEENIMELKDYLSRGILKSKRSLSVRVLSLERQLSQLQRQFDDLPEREKSMVILERDFLLNQKIYKFLAEKKMESSIVQAATISFHRIIENGTVPKDPVSPNKKFLAIVAGFLMVMMSILFIYVRSNFASRTQTRIDVEKQSAIPVIGIVPKLRSKKSSSLQALGIIATELMTRKKISKHQVLTVISSSKKEGKTYVSDQLSRAFSALDWKVLLVDYNLYNRSLTHQYGELGSAGLINEFMNPERLNSVIIPIDKNMSFLPSGSFSDAEGQLINPEYLATAIGGLKEQYDLVIIDTPATTITNDAIMLIKKADCVLHVLRCGKTPTHMIHKADLMAHEYELTNMNLLINATPKAFNFNGSLTGSRYHYDQNSGVWATIKRYFDIYIR